MMDFDYCATKGEFLNRLSEAFTVNQHTGERSRCKCCGEKFNEDGIIQHKPNCSLRLAFRRLWIEQGNQHILAAIKNSTEILYLNGVTR